MEKILEGLNEKQVQAVRAIKGPVLVVSGPGSGKTRCLTHRIAYLIASGVPAERVLAVTFTNKAANEIKERVEELLKKTDKHALMRSARPMLGTFHAIGLRILRKEIARLGYSAHFAIADKDDQLALAKKVVTELGLDSKRFPPGVLLARASKLKTALTLPGEFEPGSFSERVLAQFYTAYQGSLKRMNAVDFDDLIMLPVKIFQQHPAILKRYQRAWDYILVDEYQDTSHDQYILVTLLAKEHRNLFCIGDDAQSIYMFRDADIRNILNFQKDYPDATVVLLERNYRSTKNILAAAQSIIDNNKSQIPKELWTSNDHGQKLIIKEALNERDEAQYVADTVRDLAKQGRRLRDCVILYRTHAQSRAIEEALIAEGIPYQIVGGIRFYERKEIKDILAYLRLLNNPSDVISFERIYNVPARGIGKSTAEAILAMGEHDLAKAVTQLAVERDGKNAQALASFAKLMNQLAAQMAHATPAVLIKFLIKKISYEEYLKNLSGDAYENAEERIENLHELLTVAKKYDTAGIQALALFLEDIALLQETDKLKETGERLTLMTIHSSKGLEFPVVFVTGMEEGLFPHSRTIFAPHELEEERRLCYVAVSRAKERLFLTYARWRNIFGSRQANIPSRFVGEIPEHLADYELYDGAGDAELVIDY